ncbi:MAG: carboxypeptidase regulatory-like domain-containing protein [Anaerolineales bacterium]|nr:carboxypeptidase regulatory-like domain-containing protein [Anaerolineales bacterium]
MGVSPEVTVQGGTSQPTQPQSNADTITVYGLVYDDATGKPINNAYVFILTPGVTYEQWANENYADKYISTYLQTGSDGKYKITGIPRNTEFTLVYSAQGYYDAYADNQIAGNNDPAEFELNVGLTK